MPHILVVDDEPHICRVLTLVLSERGHSVDAVASGEMALEAAAGKPPDLALIDISLPGMSGLETFTALRARQPGLSAVFITAFGSIRSAIAAIRRRIRLLDQAVRQRRTPAHDRSSHGTAAIE